MSNKNKMKNLITVAVICLILGFFAGQFLRVPALESYNLLNFSGIHNRESTN